MRPEEGSKFIQSMLDIEDRELAAIPSSNHHVVAFGRLKGRAGLVSPFFLQASGALKRRLARFRRPSG